ncbi:amidase family protein [Jatrophihabitans sp. DSM 45814]
MSSPGLRTASEVRESLDSGTSSAAQLTSDCLERIARLNPDYNAVIAVDEGGAVAAARASDRRRAAGRSLGPLDGVCVLIKDNIEAVGLPGTAGSRALLRSAPISDAPVVQRLRNAGLVVLGSTNLSEWANFRSTASTSGWSAVGGQTRNPYDVERNTSGSSSGSAVAAALGLAPLTVGTETDGSIVSPAGCCGVVGFKPTRGRVPGSQIVPISSRQDVAGPITRTVADAAALYSVLCGDTASRSVGRPLTDDQRIDLRGLTVSVWRPEIPDAAISSRLSEILETAAGLLEAAGCRLIDASPVAPAGPFHSAEFEALVAEFAVELPAYLAHRPGNHPRTWAELLAFNRADGLELSPFSDEIFALAAAAPALDSDQYRTARGRADAEAAAALEGILSGADLAITLTNPPAWPIAYGQAEDDHLPTSSPAAVTGAPSLSLPGGYLNGLPIGITVFGRPGQDSMVLSFAGSLEALLPARIDPLVS